VRGTRKKRNSVPNCQPAVTNTQKVEERKEKDKKLKRAVDSSLG